MKLVIHRDWHTPEPGTAFAVSFQPILLAEESRWVEHLALRN
jgi:hypothetical protein